MSTSLREWRGTGHEAHLWLGAEDNAVVQATHARAAALQDRLDATMLRVRTGVASHGGDLVGLDHSLKSLDSFQSKVARDTAERGAAAETAAGTRDLNRYTFTFPADRYQAGVNASYEQLGRNGFTPIEGSHKNTWEQPDYKGINTGWRHIETGQPVEVQFHTPESFQAKETNHLLYELDRSGSLSDEERDACRHLQAERYRQVPVPVGHERIVPPQPTRPLPEVSEQTTQTVRTREQELAERKAAEHRAAHQERQEPGDRPAGDRGDRAAGDSRTGPGHDAASPDVDQRPAPPVPQQSTASGYEPQAAHDDERVAAAMSSADREGNRAGDGADDSYHHSPGYPASQDFGRDDR